VHPNGNDIKVTVLMPVYNAEKYIGDAITSVLEQTFSDFELLIVNDGSTDDTLKIINTFSDPRIRIIHQENKGVSAALNNGLKRSKAEYIARFDADDICYSHRLEVQYNFLKDHPEYVLVGSASDFIDQNGEFLFKGMPPALEHEELKKMMYETVPFDHPTVMYKRSVALSLNGYPEEAIHFEDHIFWTFFFDKGKLCNMEESLIKHRFHPGSATIDEKWRGSEFREIKYTSIKQGFVSPEDAEALRSLLLKQDSDQYKEAAYYSMIGKKYLWNQYKPKEARMNLKKAISIMPQKPEPYMLYLLSFLPSRLIDYIYNLFKK
jgi:glycosyltransferase involved in cell wall biosynthesis